MSTRDIKRYQIGGSVGTTADSLAIYKNAMIKEKFYRNNPDYQADASMTANSDIRSIVNKSDPYYMDYHNKYAADNFKDGNPAIGAKPGKYGSKTDRFYKKGNITYLGDIMNQDSDSWFNTDSPPIMLHGGIMPQGWTRFFSRLDVSDVPYYDPTKIWPKSLGPVPKEAFKYSTPPPNTPLYPSKSPKSPHTLSIARTITPFVRSNPDPKRSVADNLKAMGKDSSYSTRKQMFIDAGLGDTYEGNADENVKLNEWLHAGGLDKPAVIEGTTGFKRSVKPMTTNKIPATDETPRHTGGYKRIPRKNEGGEWDDSLTEYVEIDDRKLVGQYVNHIKPDMMTNEMMSRVVADPNKQLPKISPSFRLGGPVVLRSLITKTRL